MTTSFGISVSWDGKSVVNIESPVSLWNATCGLCGSFDGNPDNDFTTPDRQMVSFKICYLLKFLLI